MQTYLKLLLMIGMMLNVDVSIAKESECVVVLHGMGRTHRSMSLIEDRLMKEGYKVINDSYPSTDETIPVLADSAVGGGVAKCLQHKPNKIHFVTHSLGGILVRAYLQDNKIKQLGRIVMLAPPNKGSEIAEILKTYSLYNMATGPAGQSLGTEPESIPNQLKPIVGEIGIIAGNFSSDPWFSPLIPGDDDGKVSVERAKLDEMQDFIVMDAGHTFIMRNDAVIDQIMYFLKSGMFKHE